MSFSFSILYSLPVIEVSTGKYCFKFKSNSEFCYCFSLLLSHMWLQEFHPGFLVFVCCPIPKICRLNKLRESKLSCPLLSYGFILKLSTNFAVVKHKSHLLSSLPATLIAIIAVLIGPLQENTASCVWMGPPREWQMETKKGLYLCTSSDEGKGKKQRGNEHKILCRLTYF